MMPAYTKSAGTPRGQLSTDEAIQRYCAVRHRLPVAAPPQETAWVENLDALAQEFDLFVLDGFGVLNVGNAAVPGAAQRIESLRDAGCQVVVLTNGATSPTDRTVSKYHGWAMKFEPNAVVSSRDALVSGLQQVENRNRIWGIAAPEFAAIEQLPVQCHLLGDDDAQYACCDGFVLLSALEWNDDRQTRLKNALRQKMRPVLVGNPDLVAPHPDGLSLEPGWFAHDLADDLALEPVFYGKPFQNAFDAVVRRFPGFAPDRIAMVGDSPHTDILGGCAAGWRTVLIQKHGLCKEHDLAKVFEQTGIRPNFVATST